MSWRERGGREGEEIREMDKREGEVKRGNDEGGKAYEEEERESVVTREKTKSRKVARELK